MLVPMIILLFSVLHLCLCVDLTYYVEEGKNPGTYLGDIAADSHLLDSVSPKDHSLIRFSQMQQSVAGRSPMFRVSKETGKLYTAQVLDAETICKQNEECFKIVDVAVRQAKSFMKILEVKVVIQDVNDHEPEFPENQFKIQFSEESIKGAKRSIPNAIDKDVGLKNSQLTYHLKKNIDEPFTLSVAKSVYGTSKLSITLEDELDREVKDSYTVQVIAKDGGSPPKQCVLNVQISVTDVNDNPPVFSQDVYNVSIRYEHDISVPVVILSAKDLDLSRNDKVTYSFNSKTSDTVQSLFDVNKETGEIFLHKKLTLRQELKYELYVEASDGGNPPLSSITMVLVNVINQQNNAPRIDVNFVSASKGNTATISEDIEVGSFVAYVKVTDDDAGQNGEISCYLNDNKFLLQGLGSKRYKVTVKNQLDREIEDDHEITISCQDKGFPPLQSERKISIKVMDVNDVRPQFPKDTFKFWIDENQKPKYPIGTINATDNDLGAGGKLTYSLLSRNKEFLPFQITDNGLITTVISLDHEFQNIYRFQVLVKDNGIPSLNNTANIIVEVKDENDNAPYFTFPSVNPFLMDLVYYPHHTNNITVLIANDRDSRENAFLKYEIIGGNERQLFAINHYTGLLAFTRVATQQDAGTHDLQFVVKDSGTPALSATANLSLMLTVSNKTFKSLNAVHTQTEENTHMFLLIIIVLVSMTVSVPITAAISICFVRCKKQRNVPHRSGVTLSDKHEQRHLMCPSHLESSWADTPSVRTTDTDPMRNAQQKGRRGIYPGNKLTDVQKGSTTGMKFPTNSDIIYQVSEKFSIFFQGVCTCMHKFKEYFHWSHNPAWSWGCYSGSMLCIGITWQSPFFFQSTS